MPPVSSKGPVGVSSRIAWNVRECAGSCPEPPMLVLGCIYLSNLWEELTAFRIQREFQRLYPGSAANDADFGQPLAA